MNNNVIDYKEYKGYTINLLYDQFADYNDCDHLGTFYTNVPRELNPDNHLMSELRNEEGLITDDEIIFLCVNAYIHSGIALSTSNSYPFNDRWDGGLGGIMAVSKKKVKEWYGVKEIAEGVRKDVLQVLQSEVEELNDYCQGRVYAYEIFDEEWNCMESCCGFVGDMDYCLESAKRVVDALIENEYKEKFEEAMRLEEVIAE